ncbi:siderophore-interacting protein [Kingella potus]|uniref:siderophore-interacting protein n=1 Tax=Kingella potus TaxID=265175 RepID=UPI001FD061CF|nr:siderophore-interacting protein [Kingella potus]UOP00648.1 siderophore-interacting protein [Kingella potus]
MSASSPPKPSYRHTRRIFFTSPELADYPCDGAGVPFKLLLPHSGQSEPKMPDRFANYRPQWDRPSEKPISRTYTVRRFDRAARILTVDFVLHGDNGPAAAFAAQAAPGQTVGITAPKRGTLLKPAAEYLMAGDLTALPAIAAMLEELAQQSPAARGKVLLLLPEAADLPELVRPAGIEILPFFGGSGQNPAIAAAVSQSRPAGGDCYVWFAAEAALVAALRPIARQDWGLPPARCYAVPYWRQGEAEEAYHEQRHAFVDNDAP